jgi:hypothetical protein
MFEMPYFLDPTNCLCHSPRVVITRSDYFVQNWTQHYKRIIWVKGWPCLKLLFDSDSHLRRRTDT